MVSLAPRTRKTLEELEAVLAAAEMPARIAKSCERLVERLRRPIRVGLIGFETEQRKRLMAALIGAGVLPDRMDWPTVEIGFAEQPHTRATLSDGSTLAADGMPQAELFEQEVAFLKVGAPLDALRRVTFLYLAAGNDADEQSAALRWAARRIDFALWCTRDFSPVEAQVWAAAAPELKNHAYLVTFEHEAETSNLRDRTPSDFQRVIALPAKNSARGSGAVEMQAAAQRLFERLASDIDDALGEDLDAARVLLHRYGKKSDTPKPQAEASQDGAIQGVSAELDRPAMPARAGTIDLLSEPLIFLKRWSRDLFETLEWHDEDSPDWAGDVLDRCCDVTDGLRDRAAEWPEDEGRVVALRGLVDDAADMVTLLQIEGGPEQAEDAAALLLQLRSAFEATLTGPATPMNRGDYR